VKQFRASSCHRYEIVTNERENYLLEKRRKKYTRFAQKKMPALQNKTNTPDSLPLQKKRKKKKRMQITHAAR
jgi:hypothetical protein